MDQGEHHEQPAPERARLLSLHRGLLHLAFRARMAFEARRGAAREHARERSCVRGASRAAAVWGARRQSLRLRTPPSPPPGAGGPCGQRGPAHQGAGGPPDARSWQARQLEALLKVGARGRDRGTRPASGPRGPCPKQQAGHRPVLTSARRPPLPALPRAGAQLSAFASQSQEVNAQPPPAPPPPAGAAPPLLAPAAAAGGLAALAALLAEAGDGHRLPCGGGGPGAAGGGAEGGASPLEAWLPVEALDGAFGLLSRQRGGGHEAQEWLKAAYAALDERMAPHGFEGWRARSMPEDARPTPERLEGGRRALVGLWALEMEAARGDWADPEDRCGGCVRRCRRAAGRVCLGAAATGAHVRAPTHARAMPAGCAPAARPRPRPRARAWCPRCARAPRRCGRPRLGRLK